MIIGIAGQALAGKDTLATAIQKHLYVAGGGLGLDAQDTTTYGGALIAAKQHTPIMHFADALRDVVEAIFGCRYETQEEKAAIDTWWQERIRHDRGSRFWDHKRTDGSVVQVRDYGDDDLGSKDLTGRWLLQFLGMLGRGQLHPDIWLLTLERRISKSTAPHHIISDVRFNNEAEWVRKHGGIVIQIKRFGQAEPGPDAHASEKGVSPELITSSFTSPSVEATQDIGRDIAQRVLEGWKAAGHA